MKGPAPIGGIRPGHVPSEVYKQFVDKVGDQAVFFLDNEGIVASWNPSAQAVNGYSAAEIAGKHVSLLYPTDDVAARIPQRELSHALRDGRSDSQGWRVRKDGSMFWAHVIVTTLRDPTDQAIIGSAMIMRDLTARKLDEESLRQGEERYRILIEGVKDYAIFMLDPEGRIASWNAGAERLKGYSQTEILGQHFRIFYPPEEQARKHPEAELQKAIADGRYEEEGWRIRKDGTKFWATIALTPLYGPEGKLRGFAKVTRDLTARKLAEDDTKRRATQVASLNRELETFAYTVAHDLRAPLRAITHLADIVLNEGQIDAETRKTLEVMHKSADRMSALIENLLNLSRSTSGELRVETVDVTRIAEDLCAESARVYASVPTAFHIQPGMTAQVDANLVRITLDNLVRNAFKFSARSEKPVVEVGAERQGNDIAYFVRDNGIGFEEHEAKDLFAPFRRLKAASTFEGSGIGLATVKRIVDRHGGRIWVRAEPGKGATFYFTLAPAA